MDFINSTDFPAELYRAKLLYRDMFMATAIIKCAFEVKSEGVVPAEEQLAICEPDTETPYGTLDGDVVPIKEGCDLAVMGPAVAPERQEVPSMDIKIRIGDFKREVRVFGDRTWELAAIGFKPSNPTPFAEMNTDCSCAYGGFAIQYKEKGGPYPANPDGRGYVKLKDYVEGTRLPNIEETDELITAWEQQPTPAGLTPLPRGSSLRGGRGIDVDIERQKITYHPAAFCFAHPRMLMPSYPGGQEVEITGMTDSPTWRFTLPKIDFVLSIALGEQKYEFPLVADTLCIIPRHNRFFVVLRKALVYRFVRKQKRSATIATGDAVSAASLPTIESIRGSKDPKVPLEPEEVGEFPLSFEEMVALYPLTRIIESLPLCLGE